MVGMTAADRLTPALVNDIDWMSSGTGPGADRKGVRRSRRTLRTGTLCGAGRCPRPASGSVGVVR